MTPPLLAVAGVCKRFDARVVLAGVNLEVAPGETLALVGDNGSGKSTLLAIVGGVLAADRGDITIAGEVLTPRRRGALRQIGYVPEALTALPQLSVAELVHLVTALKAAPLPDATLVERLGLAEHLDAPLGTLSLGQRRRAMLLAALIGTPPLLVLDEPDGGLDLAAVALLCALVDEQRVRGGATLLVTHDQGLVDRVATRRARLTAGTVTIS